MKAKVLCATVHNPKLGYDLDLWLRYIKAQTYSVADILVEPDPERFDYWAKNVSYAREECRKKCLKGDYTHLWFEDVDTLPPKNALEEMLKLDKDVVCAFYPSKPDGVPGWWQMEYIPPHIRDIASKHYGKKVVMDEHIYTGTRPARIHKAGTGCFLPGTRVVCNPSAIPIETIRVGDEVLTHLGEYKPVTEVFQRRYSGELVEITPHLFNFPIRVTPEHPVYAIKTKRCSHSLSTICKPNCTHQDYRGKHCHDLYYREYSPEWITASELRKGDVVLYPRLRETKDVKVVYLTDYSSDLIEDEGLVYYPTGRSPKTGELVKLRNEVEVSSDFMRLSGYYVAEGSRSHTSGIEFSFHMDETKYALDVNALMNEIFGLKGSHRLRKKMLTRVVTFYSKAVANMFAALFGSVSEEKKIPAWFITLPEEKQVSFLCGLFRGDGCPVRSVGDFLQIVTASETLAFQLRDVLVRLGMIPSFSLRNYQNGYEITLYGSYAYKLARQFDMKELRLRSDHYRHWVDERYVYLPIRKITRFRYEGDVHNLEVQHHHSYVTNFSAHNCMLIKRRVLEVCPFPEKVPRTWTEDIIYSVIVIALGFEIWALPSVRCQHIGPTLAPLKALRDGTGQTHKKRRGSRQLRITPLTSIKVVGEPELKIIEYRRGGKK